MAGKRIAVKVTANFEANLEAVRGFLAEAGAARAFDALLDDLAATVIPNLERFPAMGRPFLSRPAYSVEARDKIEKVRARIGAGELREYLAGDYLVLYALIGRTVYLLSIKHHRQLSFDLAGHWGVSKS